MQSQSVVVSCKWGGGGDDLLPNLPNVPLENVGDLRPHIIGQSSMDFLDSPLTRNRFFFCFNTSLHLDDIF